MAICKHCKLEIGFRKLPTGGWLPTNPGGGDHFKTCKQSPSIEQARKAWEDNQRLKREYAGEIVDDRYDFLNE